MIDPMLTSLSATDVPQLTNLDSHRIGDSVYGLINEHYDRKIDKSKVNDHFKDLFVTICYI